uniref:Uncharacterized protein n=1 Tax=Ceratitis capitata TaxID=7213 RepID=W8CDM5_CERCA
MRHLFYTYLIYLFFIISLPLARQYLLTSAGEEEKDKILAKWLGVEIDGAYFYDWATGGGEHAASMVAAAAIEHTEESEVSTEGISTGFPQETLDNCFPVKAQSQRSKAEFMRLMLPKCWEDLLPVSWECSAHSSAEGLNAPLRTYFQSWIHVVVFLIVAHLLYIF